MHSKDNSLKNVNEIIHSENEIVLLRVVRLLCENFCNRRGLPFLEVMNQGGSKALY